jgi:hypothetical protein
VRSNLLRPVHVALWLYFLLLILEGVFRKWILPEWSDVIFVIRDPVVAATYVLAWRAGVFPRGLAMTAVWLLLVFSLGFAFASEAPLVVILFGLRTNYLHLPLVFVMAEALNRDDVIRFGKCFMIGAVPILALMMVQSNSPQDAWVNVGSGGRESAQLMGAMGRVRPPGPFSFIAGVVSYFALAVAFVFYGWLHRGTYSWVLLVLATAASVVAIPVSISRAVLLAIGVVAAFGLVSSVRELKRLPAYVGPIIGGFVLLAAMGESVYVQAFRERWREAYAADGTFETSILLRVLEEFFQPFRVAIEAPLLGHGIGLGTVAGARLSSGEYAFLLAESELARVVLELGPFLGFAFIAWRAWLAGLLVVKSWMHFRASGDSLSWLLTGATSLSVLSGQWGPATTLGFAIFGAGLALAALNDPEEEDEEDENGAIEA